MTDNPPAGIHPLRERLAADDTKVRLAIGELRILTTCWCEPAWTERRLHAPNCHEEYRADVETLADAIYPKEAHDGA